MTLFDFFKLLKRNLILVITLPVICMLISAIYMFVISANCPAIINTATSTNITITLLRMLLIALCIGLFAAICITLLVDMIKMPIRSKNDATSQCDLPLLSVFPSPYDGERLLANLIFQHGKVPANVAIVPIGTIKNNSAVVNKLMHALEQMGATAKTVNTANQPWDFKVTAPDNGMIIVNCPPLSEGMGAAYAAHDACATVLSITEWESSRRDLVTTIEELNLAKARLAGIVYIADSKK